ncbi:MAG: SBBP repeat-containing protein [Candidatus Thorarchaeota archaeon]
MKTEGVFCIIFLFVSVSLGTLNTQYAPIEIRFSGSGNNLTHDVPDAVMNIEFPSYFFENLGQINDKDVFFYGSISGGCIGFGCSQVFLWLEGATNLLTLDFEGANQVLPKPDCGDSHSANFFLGSESAFVNARTARSIIYESLWPGIDLLYYASMNETKYEFIVAPGSDPSQISIRYHGHDALSASNDALFVEAGNAKFEDANLIAYQGSTIVEAEFILQDSDAVCFQIGEYDSSISLVIDPLLYSSYFGGYSYDGIGPIAIDAEGYIYAAGSTSSYDFPTVGAYDETYSAEYGTCFVFKLSPEGDSLVYSTFIGGSQEDGASFIEVDSSGCVYIGGWTWSSDFPTTEDAYNSSHNGKSDGFILKLNATGNGLVYSTLIGGSGEDWGFCCTVDDFGSVIMTGTTMSSDFPILNALDSEFNEDNEFFILKLANDGSSIVFSTFLGGTGYEKPSDIATDSSLAIYIAGTNFTGTYDNILSECFILKLNGLCDEVIYNFRFGGSSGDDVSGMTVDSIGCVYVTGFTSSPDFPTVNAYDSSYNGDGDCFVLKLDSSGEFLVYSTFIGGARADFGSSLVLDDEGNVYACGASESPNFPVVCPYQRTHQGHYDCIVFKLAATGDNLLYSTYIGGSYADYGSDIKRDNQGQVYIGGRTWSNDFPTENAYDDSLDGDRDGIIIKLPDLVDSDFDDLIDYLENLIGTDPNNPDSDGDQFSDAWEYYNGFDPTDSHVPLLEILVFHSYFLVVFFVAATALTAIGSAILLRRRKGRFR